MVSGCLRNRVDSRLEIHLHPVRLAIMPSLAWPLFLFSFFLDLFSDIACLGVGNTHV